MWLPVGRVQSVLASSSLPCCGLRRISCMTRFCSRAGRLCSPPEHSGFPGAVRPALSSLLCVPVHRLRRHSTTWQCFMAREGSTRRRSHCASGRWRSVRRRAWGPGEGQDWGEGLCTALVWVPMPRAERSQRTGMLAISWSLSDHKTLMPRAIDVCSILSCPIELALALWHVWALGWTLAYCITVR